jgi:hypothetical protein
MNDKQTTRRRFLLASVAFAGITATTSGPSLLPVSKAWAAAKTSDEMLAALGRMAQLLFPHDGLDNAVYGQIISDILEAAANDPAMTELLEAAESGLDAAQDSDWLDLDAAGQVAVMRRLEHEPYMAGIRESVRFRLYYHPDLWKLINYPGSSKEHGGYLHRGFNDISWLPEES